MSGEQPMINAMSVDVEEWFQVAAFEDVIPRNQWDRLAARVERNLDRILMLLGENRTHATFFVLGWIAERHGGLVRRIVEEGHELASHGYSHRKVGDLTPHQFSDDVRRAKGILEDISGMPVTGYRAPSYSIGPHTPWAGSLLSEAGYVYSSSVYPIRHDLYGWPSAPRRPHPLQDTSVLEVPIATARMLGRNWPCGGGGYFRLYPYRVSQWAIERVNRQERQPCVFYFHPWEIDPDQPRVEQAGWRSRFRHYLNLGQMERRITRLLSDFRWGTIREVFMKEGVPVHG